MRKAEKRKAKNLTMVEVNHSRFAAEILSGNARVNLTAMAKPFGKKVNHWLYTRETQDYIKVVADAVKTASADLVEVRKGGTPEEQGTWCNFFSGSIRERVSSSSGHPWRKGRKK